MRHVNFNVRKKYFIYALKLLTIHKIDTIFKGGYHSTEIFFQTIKTKLMTKGTTIMFKGIYCLSIFALVFITGCKKES